MNKYEVLDDSGSVINLIVADQVFMDQHYAGKYRAYDPGIPAPPPEPRIIAKIDFRFRMTDAEYAGILAAAKTDVDVQAWVETFNMASEINLDSSRTAAGLDMMVLKGLLTEARKNEILSANEITDVP